MRERTVKKCDIIFALLLCLLTVWQIYRAPFGFDRCDESFYLTVPYRFLQGDVPIRDEWHVSQFSGLLLTPIMWAYHLFGGTSEGIILNFRYIYVAFQCLTAIAIYLLLRKKSAVGALCGAIVFFPFSPLYIMALSYNSMGIGLLTLSGLTLACRKAKIGRLLSGAMFAGAVLCCPYLIAAYLLWAIIKLVRRIRRGEKAVDLLFFTLGAILVAAAVALVIFSRAGLSDVLNAIPQILNDPEHSSMSFAEQTGMFFKHLLFSRKVSLLTFVLSVLLVCALLFDKKRGEHRWFYAAASALITLGFTTVNFLRYRYINYFMLPLAIVGGICYAADGKKDRDVFNYVWLTGWIYSYLMMLSSNNFYESLTASLTVTSVASAYFAGKTAEELLQTKSRKNVSSAFLCVGSAALVCAAVVFSKQEVARGTYFDFATFPTAMLDAEIEKGPANGLLTYNDDKIRYDVIYEQSEPARKAKVENVLYASHDAWLYLADEKRSAGYSAWLSIDYPQNTLGRLKEYERLNPSKAPDVLYIENNENADKPMLFAELIDTEQFELTEAGTAYTFIKK